VKAIHGPYLDFARFWVTEALPTSSRAKVNQVDLAIGLAIVKYCTSHINADGTMPTSRIKAIWNGLLKDEEIKRSFDYHRWRVVRDLIEAQSGLEMVDRKFYTGFIGMNGQRIKGLAAKWHMAGWLVKRLDEIAPIGCRIAKTGHDDGEQDVSNQQVCFDGCVSKEEEREALLEQEVEQEVIAGSLPMHRGGGRLCWNKKRLQAKCFIFCQYNKREKLCWNKTKTWNTSSTRTGSSNFDDGRHPRSD
jgi:hypothetical protein